MRFGEKLRVLIDQRRISVSALATALGGAPSATTLSAWINETQEPQLFGALAVARYFDVSLDYLAKEEIENPTEGLPPGAKSILRAVELLKIEAEEAIIRLALVREAIASESPAAAKPLSSSVEKLSHDNASGLHERPKAGRKPRGVG